MTSTPAPTRNPFTRAARPRGLRRWLPALTLIRTYQRSWLIKDLIAGLVLTAILVPVGMGYAEAAGLPAIYGLYATIVPLVAYALFGPSRILVLGPDSALAGIIAATILPLAGGTPSADRLVALAGLLAILSGALCIVAGIARFGFVTDLLSKPIRYGYLNGIALTVLVGQLPKLFGFSVSGDNLLQAGNNLLYGILNGQTNITALTIGLACLLVIVGFKRWAPNIPGILIAVSGATIVVGTFNLATQDWPRGGGAAAARTPGLSTPERLTRRIRHIVNQRTGDCAGGLCRHERAVADLRAARRLRSRSQSRTHRAGRGECGRRVVSRLCHQQQRVAHPGRRIGRREVAAHRAGGRTLHRAVVDLRADAVAELAHRGAGRSRDLRLFLAGRDFRRACDCIACGVASLSYRSCVFWAWR